MADILYKPDGTTVSTTGFREEYTQFFRLIIPTDSDDLVLDIDEPVGWADAPQKLERSQRWHGFNYEVLGETKLRFSAATGYEEIVAAFNTFGFDCRIVFQYGTVYSASYVVEYEGLLDLMTKTDDGTFFACTVKKNTLHDKVQSRMDVKLDLYDTTDLDDGTIGSITPSNLLLHSKALQEKFLFSEATGITSPGVFQKDTDIYIYPQTDPATISDIRTYSSKFFYVTDQHPVNTSPKGQIWKAFSSGIYRYQISWSFTGDVNLIPRTIATGVPRVTSWQLKAFLVQERDGIPVYTPIGRGLFGPATGSQFINDISFSESIDTFLNVRVDDNIYIFAELKYTYKGVNELARTECSFTSGVTSIQVDGQSTNDRSGVAGLTTFTALRRALWQVAGTDALVSPFFNSGCGSKYFITNGFSIRRFAAKNPTISVKDLLESLDAIFHIGYEYASEESGQKIVVKKAEDFYAGGEIIAFTECSDYTSEVASGYIYSGLDIGYNKFLEEGINYLDEYNTKHEYLFPITGHENRLVAYSSLIASGYAIEKTRREQFTEKPQDSTSYDDDCFIIAYRDGAGDSVTQAATFINFLGIKAVVIETLPVFFANGVSFAVTGTTSNNATFTIQDIELDSTGNYYVLLTGSVVSEVAAGATFAAGTVLLGVSEKNEAFDTVENVISPETSYNLRISPKRMMLNRAKWLLGTFYYKSSTAVLKNTFVKMNGDLTTQFDAGETCALGDVDKSLIIEKNGMQKSALGDGLPIFAPEWINYSVYTTRSQWSIIRKSLRGIQGGGKDYGYITVTNPQGVNVSGYPFEISRNEISGKTTVKMLRKA